MHARPVIDFDCICILEMTSLGTSVAGPDIIVELRSCMILPTCLKSLISPNSFQYLRMLSYNTLHISYRSYKTQTAYKLYTLLLSVDIHLINALVLSKVLFRYMSGLVKTLKILCFFYLQRSGCMGLSLFKRLV